jgi:hypothetical protein
MPYHPLSYGISVVVIGLNTEVKASIKPGYTICITNKGRLRQARKNIIFSNFSKNVSPTNFNIKYGYTIFTTNPVKVHISKEVRLKMYDTKLMIHHAHSIIITILSKFLLFKRKRKKVNANTPSINSSVSILSELADINNITAIKRYWTFSLKKVLLLLYNE